MDSAEANPLGMLLYLPVWAAFAYYGMGGSFRSVGLRELTRRPTFEWSVDSPAFLNLAAGLSSAALVCDPMDVWRWLAAGLLGTVAVATVGLGLRPPATLHPYAFAVLVMAALATCRCDLAACAIGALALTLLQGYEARVEQAVGTVTIWGKGARDLSMFAPFLWSAMGWQAAGCAGLVAVQWAFGLQSDVGVIRLMVVGVCGWVSLFTVLRLGLFLPMVSFRGLNRIYEAALAWTLRRQQ